ncbi:hypothetical protein ACJX0J_028855, partial [Zea mays]
DGVGDNVFRVPRNEEVEDLELLFMLETRLGFLYYGEQDGLICFEILASGVAELDMVPHYYNGDDNGQNRPNQHLLINISAGFKLRDLIEKINIGWFFQPI